MYYDDANNLSPRGSCKPGLKNACIYIYVIVEHIRKRLSKSIFGDTQHINP